MWYLLFNVHARMRSTFAAARQDGEGAAAAAAAVGLLLRAAGVRGAPGIPPASQVVRRLAVLDRLPPEGCFISCTSSLRGEEVRETGGDAGSEECSIAADEACAARRFAFCRAFFASDRRLSFSTTKHWARAVTAAALQARCPAAASYRAPEWRA